MNDKEKSILQTLLTDELILPYIVEDYLLNEHFIVQETTDFIHNVSFNKHLSIYDSIVDVKISRNIVDDILDGQVEKLI